jgi:hypothetical protein
MRRPITLLWAGTLLLASSVWVTGCGCGHDLTVAAVDPASVYNGVDFPTSIFGTGFADDKGASIIKSASIHGPGGDVALTSVVGVDANRIDAVVPKGVQPGSYDVTVKDKDGCEKTAKGALTVVGDLTVSVCAIDATFGYTAASSDVIITSTADGKVGSATCDGKTTTFVSSPRAWLVVGGQLEPIGNVAFVSGASLTGTVPSGIPVGTYDLLVQNPDGAVGLKSGAFNVVGQPVPNITAITPTLMGATTTVTVHILGSNFRAPVKVEVYNLQPPAGVAVIQPTEVPNPTVVSPTEVTATINLGNLGLPTGVPPSYSLVIRVTDTDDATFADFSALAVISSSGNLGNWTDDTPAVAMPMETMRSAGVAGQPTFAAHYLYVIGGDSGGGTPAPYRQTQIATLDKYGNIGSWMVGHNQLPAARTMLSAVAVPSQTGVGGYVYAIGGYDGSAAVTTVSRAKILLPNEAPVVTKTAVSLKGTLAKGTWYYRVAAVLDGTDPGNPNGETLPSEEVAAHTVDNGKVTLEWMPVPHAASYRVYRTAAVNGTSKDEVLLAADVPPASDAGMPSYVDDGKAAAGTERPLVLGELGVWVDVAKLNQPRRFLGAALAHDPNGAAYLYAVGGDSETGYNKKIGAAATVHQTYEYAPLTDDGLTLGAWTEDMTHKLTVPRSRIASPVGDKESAPTKITTAAAYVYAVGGANVTGAQQSYEVATVTAGGALGAWAQPQGSGASIVLQGTSALISSDRLFAMGGADTNGDVSPLAAASNGYATPPSFGTLNSDPALRQDLGMTETIACYGSLVFSSAHVYLLGGSTDAATALKRVWSIVF